MVQRTEQTEDENAPCTACTAVKDAALTLIFTERRLCLF